ncbi:trimeric intracellular cation channel family protein [Magnetospirillum sulfuroxidans]|uniref:Trimeric intracellular cation channel family protein n=1 Tax=Magnetospirillum sulfuroxidans TaxID=611300 RepID=A0ABS5I824_9PROT|nr:trimeric intracellular cation channel family protein [Magnetospirillum sulfuroxidans]MBR9970569.1 trimeric intracellular cation channel family protein [Magnetospirillum sulfuroxidans]
MSETLGHAFVILDVIGLTVFAITGALVAARKEMDPVGFMVVGTATAIGGGTIRDLVLGIRPVFWVDDPSYLVISLTAALATFWAAKLFSRIFPLLLWLDALGMALFAVAGAQKAVAVGAPAVVAIVMGVMTASFGGLIRDIFCGEKPLMFHREIYATAAGIGAVAWLALHQLVGLPPLIETTIAIAVGFAVRAAAIIWGLHFPHYKPR